MKPSLESAVLIVGAGPTGLMLACELARRGLSFRIVDALPGPAGGSRAKGVQPRTLEVLDDLGVVDQALADGRFHVAMLMNDRKGDQRIKDPHEGREPTPDTPYASTLMIPQWRIEAILRDRLAELGTKVEYTTQLTNLTQDETGVSATLQRSDDTEMVRVGWLVGCDGGRSHTRTLLEVNFTGETNEGQRLLVGDVKATGLDREYWHIWDDENGFLALAPLPNSDIYQFQAAIGIDDPREPSLLLMQRIVSDRTRRDDIRLSAPTWMSVWRANVRMVDRYRVGHVFLAGDAAHVHSPAGAQGMNTGIQDTYNLGWKLAQVICGADATLLDTYEEERLPIAAWVLGMSDKLHREGFEQRTFPGRRDADTLQLGLNYRGCKLTRELRAAPDRVRAGDRAPDAPDLRTASGKQRMFDLLRGTHFTLLTFGEGWENVIEHAQTRFGSALRSFAVGTGALSERCIIDAENLAARAFDIQQATLMVIRPDGYIGLATNERLAEPVIRYLSGLITCADQ